MPTSDCGSADAATLEALGALGVRISFGRPSDDTYPALVDTGATASCIDSTIALALSLPIIDQTDVAGVHGRHTVSVCLGQISVPALAWQRAGRFAIVDLLAGGQPHLAILDRDFLRRFTMLYDGRTGAVTLSNDMAPWNPQHGQE